MTTMAVAIDRNLFLAYYFDDDAFMHHVLHALDALAAI